MNHFANRLCAAVRAKGNALCVGLDPRWDALPGEIRARHGGDTLASVARACEEFCFRVIDVVAPLVAVVKPQMAFFEVCGPAGLTALQRVLRKARDHHLVTILDGKRNDIASTAMAYAEAALSGVPVASRQQPVWDADALTISELRICRMAAEGMSNPAIAQALFVTRGTVESHLHVAYRKLGISSRKALPEALATYGEGPTETV